MAMALAATVVKRKGDDGHEQNAHDGKEQIAVHHTQPEEDKSDER
jgi:hypothetical protein